MTRASLGGKGILSSLWVCCVVVVVIVVPEILARQRHGLLRQIRHPQLVALLVAQYFQTIAHTGVFRHGQPLGGVLRKEAVLQAGLDSAAVSLFVRGFCFMSVDVVVDGVVAVPPPLAACSPPSIILVVVVVDCYAQFRRINHGAVLNAQRFGGAQNGGIIVVVGAPFHHYH